VRVKKIRMVPKVVQRQELEWEEDVNTIQKSRWVTKNQMSSRMVD